MYWKIVIVAVLFVFLLGHVSAELVFEDSLDSIDSIRDNGGDIDIEDSSFVDGVKGNAIHLKSWEYITYDIHESSMKKGTIDFFFKSFEDFHGLVNLDAKDGNLMAFRNHDRAWMEVTRGGQSRSSQQIVDGKWHHLAITWDCKDKNSKYSVYLDGVKGTAYNTWKGGCDGLENRHPLILAVGSSYFYSWGEGVYDDVRVHDEVLGKDKIKKRAKKLKDIKDEITLISPENGFVAHDWGYNYDKIAEFEWNSAFGKYAVELSSDENFKKSKKLKGENGKWTDQFEFVLEKEELQSFMKNKKYTGDDFYWRVVAKKGGAKSEAREISIDYIPENPYIEYGFEEGDEIGERSSIYWEIEKAVESELEISGKEDFSDNVKSLGKLDDSEQLYFDKKEAKKVKKVHNKDDDKILYLRIHSVDVAGNDYYSDHLMFTYVDR